ncbi:MAG: TldD/PmbA family protein [Promethearchaeota archaeon]|nr:MAG: TldD/PmbA family protein [Candidatus Lokiarchaeota archaeon]
MKNKLGLIEDIINSKNVSEYEIYLVESNIYETQFLKNSIESERQVKDLDYFIRILNQNNNGTGIGIVKGNQIEEQNIGKNIEDCIKLSKINQDSKYYFPSPQSYESVEPVSKEILENPVKILLDLSDEIKIKISNLDKTKPTFGRLRLHIDHKYLKNSSGLNLNSTTSYFYLEFAIKAEEGEKISEFWDVEYITRISDLDLVNRIDQWSEFALANITAKEPVSNEKATVILSPSLIKDALVPVIGFHSSGKAFHEKTTYFDLNKQVADSKINILDNGLLPGGLRTNPWDGEGNPHQKLRLVEGGIFKNCLYDQKYAILEGTKSTGNGIRTPRGTIENTISNLEIEPGKHSLQEIISNIKEGYFVEKCSWLNPDEFSGFFGAEIRKGYYIKNGKLDTAIKGGNISGNILEMIQNCEFISNERKYSGNTYLPYMAFSNLTISS